MNIGNTVVKAVAASDTGRKRKHNEDSWSITATGESVTMPERGQLFLVADGVGGAAAGEIASKTTVSEVARGYYSGINDGLVSGLRSAIRGAHETIVQTARENEEYQGMASTLTALLLTVKRGYIAQVGDSRAYLIRNEKIQQLTSDQTVSGDLLAKGKIGATEAKHHPQRHILLQSLGGGVTPPQPIIKEIDIYPGDRLVLCTDGLYNLVTDEEIKTAVLETDFQSAVDSLVKKANDRGGTDNITVVLIGIDKIGFPLSIRNRILTFLNGVKVVGT